MRRQYNLYVNGTKIPDGDNRIIVNGTNVRRCLVNGTDIINNFAQLKLKITMTGSVLVFSEYTTGCVTTNESGFANWKIDNIKVEIEKSDFRINEFTFQFYIKDTEWSDATSDFYSPLMTAKEFPYTANNLENPDKKIYSSASVDMAYRVYLKTRMFDVTYLPTGETFSFGNISSEMDYFFADGYVKDTSVEPEGNITHLVEFKDKTITILEERQVEQY